MIFHLITIQNTRTDDTVFHGIDKLVKCHAFW